MSRYNPYAALKQKFREYAAAVEFPRRATMWLYPKDRLTERWTLSDLYERVAAADQLGFYTIIKAEDKGLRVEYVGKIPSRPWEIS